MFHLPLSLRELFPALLRITSPRSRRPSCCARLRLEPLEDRCLLAIGFASPLPIPGNATAEQTPRALVGGDFNGDSRTDLLTVNEGIFSFDGPGSATLTLLLGNGDGSFGPAATLPILQQPVAGVAGDFNGDQKLDLATANQVTDSVSVLLGNGDATFGPLQTFAVGDGPATIVTADLNGDGNLDLVTANPLGGSVSMLWGQGNGGFQVTTIPAGDFPKALVAADLSGDGAVDLAVAGNANVNVFLGDGQGGFGVPTSFPSVDVPTALTAGDFNGDNRPDLVIGQQFGANIDVAFNDGSGGFGGPLTAVGVGGDGTTALVTGDFNGDGKLDVAVSNTSQVTLVRGNGMGGFDVAGSFAAGSGPIALVAADLNGDSKLDVAAANHLSRNVSVLLANGSGSLVHAASLRLGSTYTAAVTADFNADAKQDLAVAKTGRQISVYLDQGNDTFGTPLDLATASGAQALLTGDVNNDQRPDLVVANADDNSVSAFLGNGNGTFAVSGTFSAGAQPVALALGDFTGDGQPDLMVANRSVGPDAGPVLLLPGAGTGSFGAPVSLPVSVHPIALAAADFNQDGHLDLAIGDEGLFFTAGKVVVLLGKGDGTFGTGQEYGVATRVTALAAGDLNRDGKPDLVAATTFLQQFKHFEEGSLNVFLGNGDGSFNNPALFGAGRRYTSVALTDLDGDGNLDLATTFSVQGTDTGKSVLFGTGSGTFPIGIPLDVPPASNFVSVGEFTGNATPDLVFLGPTDLTLLPGHTDSPLPAFVKQVYRALLGREADADGLSYWLGSLGYGALSRIQFVAALTSTPEYRARVVQQLYAEFLRIAARDDEVAFWTSALAQGKTTRQMLAEILGSDNYLSRNFPPDHEHFVAAVYHDVLGRDPAANELQFWLQSLAQGTTRTAVASAIVDSPEANTVKAQRLFTEFLAHPADSQVLGAFAGPLQQGATYEQVIGLLVGSLEFFADVNTGVHRRYVAQLYRSLLKRDAGADEQTFWVNLLNGGETSPRQVVQLLQGSEEYRTRVVQEHYVTFLKRDADPAGASFFVTFLGVGGTLEQLDVMLTSSAEYFQSRGQGQPEGFVNALFQDALHRPADVDALAYFTQLLAQGTSRADVASAIFSSREFRALLVQDIYTHFLGRPADSAGLEFWIDRLNREPSDRMLAEILSADEYFT